MTPGIMPVPASSCVGGRESCIGFDPLVVIPNDISIWVLYYIYVSFPPAGFGFVSSRLGRQAS